MQNLVVQYNGRYSFVDSPEYKLGSGGFSQVFKGINSDTREEVAIRRIDIEKLDTYQDLFRQLLTSEASALTKIRSLKDYAKHLFIGIKDVWKSQHHIYMVAEYCRQGTLEHHIKLDKALPQDKLLKIMYLVCFGMKRLHSLGVMHRDIKPENIFLQSFKNHIIPKVGDFGFVSDKEVQNTKLGSFQYMAPQLQRGENYTKKIDVWAFGATIYQLYYFEGPFSIYGNYLDNILTTDVTELMANSNTKLSPQLQDAIRKCLEIDPKKRITFEQLEAHPAFFSVKAQCQKVLQEVEQICIQRESQIIQEGRPFYRVDCRLNRIEFYYVVATKIADEDVLCCLFILRYLLGLTCAYQKAIEAKEVGVGISKDQWIKISQFGYQNILHPKIKKFKQIISEKYSNIMSYFKSNSPSQIFNNVQKSFGVDPNAPLPWAEVKGRISQYLLNQQGIKPLNRSLIMKVDEIGDNQQLLLNFKHLISGITQTLAA